MGGNPKEEQQLTIWPIFTENCMKMKLNQSVTVSRAPLLVIFFAGINVYFTTMTGTCQSFGGQYISHSGVRFDAPLCYLLGGDMDGDFCNLDWCVANKTVPYGLYIR